METDIKEVLQKALDERELTALVNAYMGRGEKALPEYEKIDKKVTAMCKPLVELRVAKLSEKIGRNKSAALEAFAIRAVSKIMLNMFSSERYANAFTPEELVDLVVALMYRDNGMLNNNKPLLLADLIDNPATLVKYHAYLSSLCNNPKDFGHLALTGVSASDIIAFVINRKRAEVSSIPKVVIKGEEIHISTANRLVKIVKSFEDDQLGIMAHDVSCSVAGHLEKRHKDAQLAAFLTPVLQF